MIVMNKRVKRNMSISGRQAYTLMELLVVISIGAILMGLLLIPVYRTIQNNQVTAAIVSSQQSARIAVSKVKKDISEAVYVYDSSDAPMLLPVNGLVDSDGNDVTKPVVLQNGVLNLVMPKTQFYCSRPEHDPKVSRSFPRGDNYSNAGLELSINDCPSCKTDKYVSVIPVIPIEKGTTVVRYFLGLKHNFDEDTASDIMETDGDILDNAFAWKTVAGEGWKPDARWNSVRGIENALVLYRVEFDPLDDELFPSEYDLPAKRSDDPEKWDKVYHRRVADANVFYHPDVADVWAKRVETVGLADSMDLAIATKDDYVDGKPFRVISSVSIMPAAITGEAPDADKGNAALIDAQGFPAASFSTKYSLLGNILKVDIVRSDRKQVPQKKWVLEVNPNNRYAMLKSAASPNDLKAALTDVFDVSKYIYGTDNTVPYDDLAGNATDMAVSYNFDSGKIEFALNPIGMPALNENIERNNLTYYPEIDVYGYKFLEYSEAHVVPGSEVVSYYNAYYKDGNGLDIAENHWSTYADLESNGVGEVRYQRAPLSVGQLNYNQYKMDYDQGIIYWKPIISHSAQVFPELYMDIPSINYSIQFNKLNDKITVSYSTNEVIDIRMDMRMAFNPDFYPKSSIITEKVVVGNALR